MPVFEKLKILLPCLLLIFFVLFALSFGPIGILIVFIGLGLLLYFLIHSTLKEEDKRKQENIKRRKKYVESLGPSTRIIVNDGSHLFYKNDQQQFFGLGDRKKQYSFSGLQSISIYDDAISFIHEESASLCVGKDPAHSDTTIPLPVSSIKAIYAEMMPILYNNLRRELDKYGVTPTHEYEHEGKIFGCDINSEQFYCVYGAISVHKFSELKRVTIDDLSNNSLCSANYEVQIYLYHEDPDYDQYSDYTLYFNSKNATYNNILAMFKGIRNRQGF